ncbi:succinate dehydrogenase, cytochrome b556 subunit [Blastomyces parvus]|uniref:Succinate dehydrogenase, cytochrome b556 subunit n=1 Tax=Blastomyces parvus TaxID=2060905 RepID=A0A2B7X161_9EURO|nr:succinate dehydrogenase, cytochrome b556 subunit [Blastomyces parvus]
MHGKICSETFEQRQIASSTKGSDPNDLLRKQRLNRPTSPNLTIYRPQITSVLSILHRNTGLLVSGSFYLFFAAYVASPWLGWHIDSTSLAASFGALPVAAKVLLKTTVALPFTFHSFNGVRHLVWDVGRGLTNKQVIRSAESGHRSDLYTSAIAPLPILPVCRFGRTIFSSGRPAAEGAFGTPPLTRAGEGMAASGVRAMGQDRWFSNPPPSNGNFQLLNQLLSTSWISHCVLEY